MPKNDEGEVKFTNVKRSKPLLYAYEKEIVMYAHHKKLDYFSTECIYSPEAFRGSARTLIKNLERIRPESILDVVRSGIDMAKLVPGVNDTAVQDANVATGKVAQTASSGESEGPGGCGTSKESGGEMAAMEKKLQQDEAAETNGNEIEIKMPKKEVSGQNGETRIPQDKNENADLGLESNKQQATGKQTVPIRTKNNGKTRKSGKDGPPPKQKLGQCERCGYLSSQAVCQACVLLEGLNKARPRTGIEVGGD
jgi:cytoplasmic tRNA 2-thiolation protein 1